MGAWDLLGIEPTQDVRAIKRAYSVQLKTTRPDDDAQAYQALREAYDWAQHYAKYYVAYEGDDEDAVDEVLAAPPIAQPAVEEEAPVAEPPVVPIPVQVLPESAQAVIADATPEPAAHVPTVESLLKECTDLWTWQGAEGLEREWPRLQALLQDLPIAVHSHASAVFAQFVVLESGLPVAVLVALTKHFQWGLDFRVNQSLGPQLSQALHERLSAAEVFAALRPDSYTRNAWALALARLWDNKRRFVAGLLSFGLDCRTRHRILQTRLGMLHVLGASHASAFETQAMVARGGVLQGCFFALLVAVAVFLLHDLGTARKLFSEVIGFGVLSAAVLIVYSYLCTQFSELEGLWRRIRKGKHLDAIVFAPALVALVVFCDQKGNLFGGYTNSATFFGCVVCLYAGLWLVAPTDEHPWRTLVLPTFLLLTYGMRDMFPETQTTFLISLAFAWTMGAHVVLRKFPQRFESEYSQLIKLGVVRSKPWMFLFFFVLPTIWAMAAIAMLPILLFRMARDCRVLYAGVSMYAGALLANVRGVQGQTFSLLVWVLSVVFLIQVLQTALQSLADYGLKKLSKK